jgi:hypothetical protein
MLRREKGTALFIYYLRSDEMDVLYVLMSSVGLNALVTPSSSLVLTCKVGL